MKRFSKKVGLQYKRSLIDNTDWSLIDITEN